MARSASIDELLAHQNEAERMFCACILSGAEDIALAEYMWLSPDIFVDKRLGKYWGHVREGNGCIKSAIIDGLLDELTRASLTIPSGFAFMSIRDYAAIISEDVYIIGLMRGVSGVVKSVMSRNIPDIRNSIEALHDVSAPSGGGVEKHSEQMHSEFVDEIRSNGSFIPYGIPQMDKALGGLFGSEVTTVAGRPSMGKTAFVTQVGRNCVAYGKKVAFFSLEMSAMQLWARMACPMVNLEWKDVRAKLVSADKLDLLEKQSEVLRDKYKGKFIVIDEEYTISGIHQACLRIKPDFVVIDQLPDIEWYDRDEPEVSWYGKAMKYIRRNIAKRMNIPALIVHQLNRGVEGRTDKHPTMADLRMSGEIEQRSDVVLLIYRSDYYDGRLFAQVNVPAEINPAKNRQGEAGSPITLSYNLKEQWFS